MRRAKVGGVFGLWTRATRTSRLAAHWLVFRISSTVWYVRYDDFAIRTTSSRVIHGFLRSA